MKNLMAIVGDYYPYPSSNTNCFEPLLNALENDGWHVDIVTLKQWLELANYEKEKSGREIWRIDDPRSMNTIMVNKLNQIPAPKYLILVNKCFSVISKSLFFLHYCLGKPEKRFASWSQEKTVSKCLTLHTQKKYDAVLSVSHPVVSHEIARKFLNGLHQDKPKWILYEFDPYCYNEHIYGKNCFKKLSSKQHDLFKACDAIFLIPELYDFYQKTPFDIYQEKMVSINFPNMNPITVKEKNASPVALDTNKLNCVFGGAFGIKIRNPQYALHTFAQCKADIQWVIMTGFDLTNMMKQVKDKNKVISIYPMQSRDTSYQAMLRCDVLVNIGNTVVFQTPGKIFEYMAMGKPIIHFQKIENDPCLKYFENYPMMLIIDEREDNAQKHAKMIEDFCVKYKGKTLSYEEVEHYMPQYISKNVVEKFVGIVNGLVEVKDETK